MRASRGTSGKTLPVAATRVSSRIASPHRRSLGRRATHGTPCSAPTPNATPTPPPPHHLKSNLRTGWRRLCFTSSGRGAACRGHCRRGNETTERSTGTTFGFCENSVRVMGGIFALRAHCALLLDYVPPKRSQAHPLETPLELGDPNCPSSRKLQTTFPSHNTHHAQLGKP